MLLKKFEHPDRVETFEKGRFEIITVGPMTLGRATYEPGWRWSTHIGARDNKQWCTTEHVGIVVSGTAAVSYPDGTVEQMQAGDAFHITGEHDSWVIGDDKYVSIHLAGAAQYAS